ncbi:MAG TPA: hypothetical protein VJ776_00475 [Thermoanaerobaculia bacterium]|nr:hypothetical protein [Thermoanaerobaculia bacterium]
MDLASPRSEMVTFVRRAVLLAAAIGSNCSAVSNRFDSLVLLGTVFIAAWLGALYVLQAPGRALHLLLLVPIVSFVVRAFQQQRERDAGDGPP